VYGVYMSDLKTFFKDLFIYQDNKNKYNFILPESQNISGNSVRAASHAARALYDATPTANKHQYR